MKIHPLLIVKLPPRPIKFKARKVTSLSLGDNPRPKKPEPPRKRPAPLRRDWE
jgi:hypothetical protein